MEAGTPLVELSPHFINRDLGLIDAEVLKLLQESKLAQARLLVEEQRWLTPEMRLRPDRPSLEGPTEQLYAGELALLQTRRRQLLEDREALLITASLPGRVVPTRDWTTCARSPFPASCWTTSTTFSPRGSRRDRRSDKWLYITARMIWEA